VITCLEIPSNSIVSRGCLRKHPLPARYVKEDGQAAEGYIWLQDILYPNFFVSSRFVPQKSLSNPGLTFTLILAQT